MNLNTSSRKVFFIISGVLSALLAILVLIVGISSNLSSMDQEAPAKYAPPTFTPAQLSGPLAPPPLLNGRIGVVQVAADATTTPFFDQNGDRLSLESLKGEGLIINFWATWCVPCVKEMPALDRLAGELEKSGVRVLALSVDRKALEKVPPFYAAHNIANLDVLYDEKGQLSKQLGVKGLPTTVLVQASGDVLGQVVGILEWDAPEVSQYLKRALGPALVDKPLN